jgi:hypothetical protein
MWRGDTPDPMRVVGEVMRAIRASGATRVKVDSVGIGWAVTGRLAELRTQGVHGAEIVAVNVGATPTDPTRFVRLRDEIWWEVGRELSRTQGWDLREVDDATVAQLIAPRYAPDSSGRIKVERKEETRARLGRSPDDADALLLAFYAPVVPETDPDFVHNVVRCEWCGDPYPWHPGRSCWHCRHPAPPENPYKDRLAQLNGG